MIMQMNPILITIGKVEIHWYSLFILLAFIFTYRSVKSEAWRYRVSKDFIFNLAFWIFIGGVLGARIWYVLFNLKEYAINPLDAFKIWEGGLAIHGGLIAGLLTIYLYCKKYKFRLIRMLDFIAPALLLGQAIGRWGNFFNGEAHGYEIAASTLGKFVPKFIVDGMTINGVTYFPTFLVESIACLLVFIAFLFIRRARYIKVGTMTAFYLIAYGLIRFFIEFQRTDALMIGNIRMAQIVSIIFFIAGLTLLIYNSKKNKLEDLYNDVKNIPDLKY